MDNEVIIEGPDLAPYQTDILESKARFTVTQASTKVGKTYSHIWWLFAKAHGGYMQPGEKVEAGQHYWWVAPVYGQAEIAFNRMKLKVVNDPNYKINLSNLTITTPLGTIIEFKSAEKPDNLYGEDVYAAVFDEYTRARVEAWNALYTTLTATKGQCKLIGNAKGKKNWGYLLAQKAKDPLQLNYEFHKVTAYDAVEAGILDIEIINQAKQDLPEDVFNELYLAEPSEDGSNPFGYEYIRRCIRPLSSLEPVCFGIDLAKRVDYTVFIGLDTNGSTSLLNRFKTDWGQTTDAIGRLPDIPTAIDSTGVGDPIVEAIQRNKRNVEGVVFTGRKQKLMEGLAVAIQSGLIGFPEGIITDELEAFEFVYTRTGVRYEAPAGVHDDTVCALALAWSKWTEANARVSTRIRRVGNRN